MIAIGQQRWVRGALAALSGAMLVAAGPHALAPASGGYWQVAHDARGAGQGVCVADPVVLAQWEHRAEHCRVAVLSDQGNRAVIDYSCPSGGFGRSELTLLTPRTLRIATQGIARAAPFNYVLHARRVGDCPRR